MGSVNDYKTIERGIDTEQDPAQHRRPARCTRTTCYAGEEADVQILVDGSDSNTAGIALGYAEAVVQTYAAQLRSDAQVRRGGQACKCPSSRASASGTTATSSPRTTSCRD